jgi:putative sporulation protein YyaC
MWNSPSKKKPEKNDPPTDNSRTHIDHNLASQMFQSDLNRFLSQLYDPSCEIIILCIGTDRSTGDSLGPLVGSKLVDLGLNAATIFGTLDFPVHAVNLQQIIAQIRSQYSKPFIIAVDACLGRFESIGYISIKEGPLQPGTGVNKNLPAVGDLQIVGIVNVGGFMEYMVLQNTRLNLVMKMADIIGRGIFYEVQKINQQLDMALSPEFPLALETLPAAKNVF